MGFQTGLILYVLAAGFVAAGLLNALHQSIVGIDEDEVGRFLVLRFDSPASIAWSMLICVFAGPYLVLSNGYHFWRMNVLPTSALLICAILSMIWSFCSGVFIIESVLALSAL
jgi:hypothetical protein